MKVNLSSYSNDDYDPGAGFFKRMIWYYVNLIVFNSGLFPVSSLKAKLLRLFGAEVGVRLIIKPYVNIKYPWRLKIGDDVWLGEKVWIDNLDTVVLESSVCVSQQSYLLTGNHDYKDPVFGLMTGPIYVEQCAWLGARTTICPGVRVCECAVISVGSVLTDDAESFGIYQGAPAVMVKRRVIR